MSYLGLFWMFFKVGLFTIGGGYAMLPVIQEEVVDKRKLLDTTEFVDALAVSQSSPGALAINISVFLGYKMKGILGAFIAVLGSSLPSYLIIMLVSTVFFKYRSLPAIENIFAGIRAAVVAMIAVSLISLIKTVKMDKFGKLIFIVASILLVLFTINPIPVLILGALASIIYERVKGED